MEPFLQVRIRCELAEMKSMSIYLFVTQNALSPLEPFFHSAFIIEHLSFHFVKNRFRKVRNYSYCELLESAFKSVSQIMSEDGTIYVRTSAREFTFNTTIEILRQYFSSWTEEIIEKPFGRKTQTHLFGDSTKKPGERDIIFTKR